MTPVAAHIAKAERRLAGIEPHSVTEAAVVAVAHAVVAYVRHETGYPHQTDTEGEA